MLLGSWEYVPLCVTHRSGKAPRPGFLYTPGCSLADAGTWHGGEEARWRCRGGPEGTVVTLQRQRQWWRAHPVASSTSLIGLGFSVGGYGGSVEPRCPSLDPHLPFMCAVRQGPTNRIRVGLP